MTVLEKIRSNPGLARALFRGLVAKGGSAEMLPFLHDVCPPGAGDFSIKDGDARDETLAVCSAIGLINIKDGLLELAVQQEDWSAADTVDSFRRLMNRRFMAAAVDVDPFSRGLGAFCGAIAWLLAQDPLRPIEKWDTARHGESADRLQQQNLRFADRLLYNGSYQWPIFVRWVTFLGFAELVRVRSKPYKLEVLVPDPTSALDAMLPSSGAFSGREFLTLLASTLPVVDNGSVRRAVEARWQGDAPPEEVSPTLSVALLRLAAASRIALENVSDSRADERIVLHTGTETRIVSSITVVDADG